MLPRYRCHKEVEAARIVTIDAGEHGVDIGLAYDLGQGPLFRVQAMSAEWAEKHDPQVGGYFVVYADGYCSYSPAAAFEEGYTAL